jgi:hypothetical protein
MFIGHFAVALAARRAEPGAALGTYMAAAQLPDLIWPYLLLAGVERVAIAPGDTAFTPLRFDSYPISHSLVTVIGWAFLFGAIHWRRTRRSRAAVWLAAAVASHWVLDFVTHRPDMPLAPGFRSRSASGCGLPWRGLRSTAAQRTRARRQHGARRPVRPMGELGRSASRHHHLRGRKKNQWVAMRAATWPEERRGSALRSSRVAGDGGPGGTAACSQSVCGARFSTNHCHTISRYVCGLRESRS